MSDTQREEMIKDFIEEVKSYVPSLKKSLQILKNDTGNKSALDEIHRLVHTVKGASAMVGLPGLSQIASQMENDLEGIIAGIYNFTEKTYQVMHETVDTFDTYCNDFFKEGVNTGAITEQLVIAYHNLRHRKFEKNTPDLDAIFKVTPKWEGIKQHNLFRIDQDEKSTVSKNVSPPIVRQNIAHRQGVIKDDIQKHIGIDSKTPKADGYKPVAIPQPELLESFYEEAEEHMEELGHALNSLSAQVTQTIAINPEMREQIRRIRRAVHTLKGASAVIGLVDFSKFAHSFEDLLDWIYETATQISPKIIELLTESSDQLARIIGESNRVDSDIAEQLRSQYLLIMGKFESLENTPRQQFETVSELPGAVRTVEIEADTNESRFSTMSTSENHDKSTSIPTVKTLRVSMERVEELVYLAGELIISSSVFDQKMEKFVEAIRELELTRNRLRDIAREMELSYEVKALERLNPALNVAITATGQSYYRGGFEEFDSLELDRYSELNMIIRTLNESVVDVGAIDNQFSGVYSEFEGNISRQRVIISELQDKIMRVRMTPMSIITNRLRRTVREVAGKLKKQVQLVIKGEEIELDRLVWEKITDPLMHLLRNAVDHGVESVEERKAMQKPDVATITLAASREGNQVLIRVSDDGAGLDYTAIRTAAFRYGHSDKIESLTENQLSEFIFKPGFSTRNSISEISGRGVGMDIVRENIRNLKGDIQISSESGRGTDFTVRIPLTLAAIRALLFISGGQKFALALNEITEIARGNPSTMEIQDENVIRINDELLPLYHLADRLKATNDKKSSISLNDQPLMLVIEAANKRCAVIIDSLIGQREIVIKSLGSHLRNVRGISGATILGDGSVVPILNVLELFWSQSGDFAHIPITYNADIEKPMEILIVDDSVSIRKVVSRLIDSQGWNSITAKDGVDALEKLQNHHPDLIILDIEMPRLNGYELLGKLRSNQTTKSIPVVMLSSRATKKHKDKSIALGAKAFVVKPYQDDEFIDLIRHLTFN